MKVKAMIAAIIIILFLTLILTFNHNHSDCICSFLSHKEERYPIPSLINSIYDRDMSETGSFLRGITMCQHGRRVHATICPDKGSF